MGVKVVLSPDDVSSVEEFLSAPGQLTGDDVLTLLDAWESAREQGIDWRKVDTVYSGADGFYYFKQNPEVLAYGFDLFSFIGEHSEFSLSPIFTRVPLKGYQARKAPSKDIRSLSQQEDEESFMSSYADDYDDDDTPANQQAIIVSPDYDSSADDEDDFSTGFLGEDDDDDSSSGFSWDVGNPPAVKKQLTITIERTGASVHLLERDEEYVLGRGKENTDFQILGNRNISRTHCSLLVSQSSILLADLNSSRGTFIAYAGADKKDRVTEPVMVEEGDIIYLDNEAVRIGSLEEVGI